MSWLTYLLKTRPVSTSNWQIINDLYNCNINSLLLHRKVRLIIPNTALSAPAAFAQASGILRTCGPTNGYFADRKMRTLFAD